MYLKTCSSGATATPSFRLLVLAEAEEATLCLVEFALMTNREDGAERKLTSLYINPLHNFGISYSLCIVINARLEGNFGLKISDEYEISNNSYLSLAAPPAKF